MTAETRVTQTRHPPAAHPDLLPMQASGVWDRNVEAADAVHEEESEHPEMKGRVTTQTLRQRKANSV
ncbi:hypothetical protein MRX96_002036 [Rhipicephalus microplus]